MGKGIKPLYTRRFMISKYIFSHDLQKDSANLLVFSLLTRSNPCIFRRRSVCKSPKLFFSFTHYLICLSVLCMCILYMCIQKLCSFHFNIYVYSFLDLHVPIRLGQRPAFPAIYTAQNTQSHQYGYQNYRFT